MSDYVISILSAIFSAGIILVSYVALCKKKIKKIGVKKMKFEKVDVVVETRKSKKSGADYRVVVMVLPDGEKIDLCFVNAYTELTLLKASIKQK